MALALVAGRHCSLASSIGRLETEAARTTAVSGVLARLLVRRSDLLEERHRVEVVATCLDLVALEDVDERGRCLLPFARGWNRAFWRLERAAVRALPGHFKGRRVAASDGACHRAGGIRECCLPALEQLDDLLGAFDRAFGTKLVIERIG